MVDRVENYSFSTLQGLLGKRRMIIPVEEDHTLFQDVEETLEWLNRKVPEQNWIAVRSALRRRTFSLTKINRSDHPLETAAL